MHDELTLPKDPCPRTFSSSNCEVSAFLHTLDCASTLDTSRSDVGSSTGSFTKKKDVHLIRYLENEQEINIHIKRINSYSIFIYIRHFLVASELEGISKSWN